MSINLMLVEYFHDNNKICFLNGYKLWDMLSENGFTQHVCMFGNREK